MRSYNADTIVAIATPPGRGGIGVVRVSGSALGEFAVSLSGKNPIQRRVTNADFRDRDGVVIDKGLLLYFAAPHSFTGEDVLELQGHGGPAVMGAGLGKEVALITDGLQQLGNGRCFYCQRSVAKPDIDHFIPFALYPRDSYKLQQHRLEEKDTAQIGQMWASKLKNSIDEIPETSMDAFLNKE